MVSVNESQLNMMHIESPAVVKSSPSAQSVDVQSKVLLMSSKKNLEQAPSGAEDQPGQTQTNPAM
jgi:hypothetical protein